jgi:hypothetical protein
MPYIIGFDTETHEGPPISVQFFSHTLSSINAFIPVHEGNVTDETLKHLSKHCILPGIYVLYGHNLKFDLLSLFYGRRHELVRKRGSFEFTHRYWDIEGVYGNTQFCRLRHTTRDVQVFIVDGFSWFKFSLAKAAEFVCPDLPKLERPEGLGTRNFQPGDKGYDHFVAYSLRDAEISCRIGEAVDEIHQEFELRQTLSIAHMAATIFRQHCIKADEPIHNVGPRILEGANAAYHGGRNIILPKAAPAIHYPVDAWDITSAYPHAMTKLPSFSVRKAYAPNQVFPIRKLRQVPDIGVYCISGKMAPCDWPALMTHDKKLQRLKGLRGTFQDEWVTGWELNEALRSDEVKLTRCQGHIYDVDKDPVNETPFQRFVYYFYDLKKNAGNPVHRFLYKIILNSISGKFRQSHEFEDKEGRLQWQHGPLWHPFIASLITGHTRAMMHQMEHFTHAIHTSTDGVFCGAGNSPKDGEFPFAPSSGLGSITQEASNGVLALLRNKLYMLYEDTDPGGAIPSKRVPGKFITKRALHGFFGDAHTLEDLMANNKRTYKAVRVNTLRTALRQGLVPNKFEERSFTLKVPPMKGVAFDWSNKEED